MSTFPCARLPYWILGPAEWYETQGDAPNVVFPAGVVAHGDELYIYYGAADSRMCLAKASTKQLLEARKTDGIPPALLLSNEKSNHSVLDVGGVSVILKRAKNLGMTIFLETAPRNIIAPCFPAVKPFVRGICAALQDPAVFVRGNISVIG